MESSTEPSWSLESKERRGRRRGEERGGRREERGGEEKGKTRHNDI